MVDGWMDAGILSVFEIPSLMQLYLASCKEVKAPLNKVALFECQCFAPFRSTISA